LTGHSGLVGSAALSADATVAVTSSNDKTLRVWALDWEYEFGAGGSAGAAATSQLD
jgi:hypothetical protein